MSTFPVVLALDSSSPRLTFALGTEDGMVHTEETQKDFRHAEAAVLQIDALLAKAGRALDAVDVLACGLGPGSFTGLRVGLSVIKALMMSKNLPCFTASSLDIIAQNARARLPEGCSSVWVLVDARRSRYYVGQYRPAIGDDLLKEAADAVMSSDDVGQLLPASAVILGDGVRVFMSEKSAQERLDIRFLSEEAWLPQARALIDMVWNRSSLLRKARLADIRPSYLKATEPEERLQEKKRDLNNGA